jgi:hypothetical protein
MKIGFGSLLIEMNVRTRTVTLCVHFPKFCGLKSWKYLFCGSQKSFWIIRFKGTELKNEQSNKVTVKFVLQSKYQVNFINFKTNKNHF